MSENKHEITKNFIENIKINQAKLLAQLKKCGFKITDKIGSEKEYEVRGVIAGLDCQITDLKLLVRNKERYYFKTTDEERKKLNEILEKIDNCVNETCIDLEGFDDNENKIEKNEPLSFSGSDGTISTLTITDLPVFIDSLKPLLRNLNLRENPERTEIVEDHIATLQRLITNAEPMIEKISEININAAKLLAEIEKNKETSITNINKLTEKINEFEEKLEEFSENTTKIETLQEESKKLNIEMSELHSKTDAVFQKIQSKNEVVDVFVKKIAAREKQLEDQKETTLNYEETLSSHKKEHEEFLEKAKILIRDAKEALSLSGSVALGSHFQKQYDNSKEFYHRWLWGGAGFLLTAIAIGVWVLLDHNNAGNISFAFARLSLMPIAIAGAWFCANQFVKQKRIIEDYAYKKVLALSLVSFREELQNTEVSEHLKSYLNMVLKEIHRYPLEALQTESKNTMDADLMKEFKNILPELLKSSLSSSKS